MPTACAMTSRVSRPRRSSGNSGNWLLNSRFGAAEYRLMLFRHRRKISAFPQVVIGEYFSRKSAFRCTHRGFFAMSFAVYVIDWVGALKGKGVWVRMYWYEAADAYRDVVDGAGLPVAPQAGRVELPRRGPGRRGRARQAHVRRRDSPRADGRPPRRRRQDDARVRRRRGPRPPDGRSACPSRGAHGRLR